MFVDYLKVLLVSMVPVVELRGAIPIGVAMGLPYAPVIILSIIGNLLPIPFLIIWGGPVLRWLAHFPRLGKPFRWILERGQKKVAGIKRALFVALWLFVAIPLPGTGAWTGALIAITLGLKLRESMPAIILGVITAGAIITLLTKVFDIVI